MSISYSTLFTRLGKIFGTQAAIFTAQGTTLPPHYASILAQFSSSDSVAMQQTVMATAAAGQADQLNTASAAALQQAAKNVIYQTLTEDAALPDKTLKTMLTTLIAKMTAATESVKATTMGAVVAAGGSNVGNGAVLATCTRADGLNQQNALAEAITATLINVTTPATAQLRFLGQAKAPAKLSCLWPTGSSSNPAGSGSSATITAIDAASSSSSLLTNGSFDTFTVADTPDGWTIVVGTAGTSLKATKYTVQTLTVSGTPTTGTYFLKLTDLNSKVQWTAPLAYNATASQVQAAINALTGFGSVTVTSTGSTPNYTHTITFIGLPGDVSAITVTNNTDGTITPSVTVHGTAGFSGLAYQFISTGAEVQAIYQPLTGKLSPLTAYALNAWVKVNSVPTNGVLKFELLDGIGGSIINDAQGNPNAIAVTVHTGVTTSFAAVGGFFRTPQTLPANVFLRIRISTATDNGTTLTLDHVGLAAATALYNGGPLVAAFSGSTAWTAGTSQIAADNYTVTVSASASGKFQQYFERNFGMRDLGLLLPSKTDSTETQADSLIS